MAKDISRQTIMTLVVLTVVVSLLGTFTVYTEVSKAETNLVEEAKATGTVQLRVGSNARVPLVADSSGTMAITIIR
ncbi:MAG: hypothetical protein ACMXX9_01415 [Candidatus Woesearchaeota archaeon]